jgi:hypothetical protein
MKYWIQGSESGFGGNRDCVDDALLILKLDTEANNKIERTDN